MFFQFLLAGSQWAKDNSYIQNCTADFSWHSFLNQEEWHPWQYPSCVNV